MTMKKGTTVRIAYVGTTDDGQVFHEVPVEEAIEFQVGMDMVLDGLDREVAEMTEGETRKFTIRPHEAFGEYLESAVERIPRETLPGASKIKPGDIKWFMAEEGGKFPATCKAVEEEYIVFDLNHPMAGKDLTYEVQLLGVDTSTAWTDDQIKLEEAKKRHYEMDPSKRAGLE